jgi:hypothetical protein
MDCEIPILDEIVLVSDAETLHLPVPETKFGGKVFAKKNDKFASNLKKPVFTYDFEYKSMCNGLPELEEFYRNEGYKKITLTDHYGVDYIGFISSSLKIYTEFEETFKSYEFSFIGVRDG